MAHFKISTITELDFDCIVAELCKERDYEDETIAALALARKKIFGRFMEGMPEELAVKSAVEMIRIMKG